MDAVGVPDEDHETAFGPGREINIVQYAVSRGDGREPAGEAAQIGGATRGRGRPPSDRHLLRGREESARTGATSGKHLGKLGVLRRGKNLTGR